MIHEMYGRVAEQLEIERQQHRQTVNVLADLKGGRLRLDQVEVSTNEDGSWNWRTFPTRARTERDEPAEHPADATES